MADSDNAVTSGCSNKRNGCNSSELMFQGEENDSDFSTTHFLPKYTYNLISALQVRATSLLSLNLIDLSCTNSYIMLKIWGVISPMFSHFQFCMPSCLHSAGATVCVHCNLVRL